ncbi:MAG TPA: branched-chain amino acid ABC transporter permease [Ktedonobacteraceae bacterium]|jgi:branched-chain amino acid transport system permease protein|nr:branched-chain amino acid ABC transporter permease [Ktedonobacteraceae bacterium]
MAIKKTPGSSASTVAPLPETQKAKERPWQRYFRSSRGWFIALLGFIVLAFLPVLYDQLFGFSAGFQLHRITLIGIFILAALAQNILTGYAAQPSLGNAAFFGVGAYMLAWLTNDLNQPYWVGILVALLVSLVLGIIVGGPALRISGAHLAIATLGLVFVAGALLNLWDVTAGRQSYDLNNLPLVLTDDHSLYLIVLVVVTLILFFGYYLLRSRVGRAWIAIRDDEAASEAFGVNVTRYKLLAFVVSAVLTGLSGALYTTWASTASSTMSSADQTIAFLAMIVVGGLGSITGSVLGAVFVVFLPLLLGQLPSPFMIGSMQVQASTLTTGIYGLLLLLALIFFPKGLQSILQQGRVLIWRVMKRGVQHDQ